MGYPFAWVSAAFAFLVVTGVVVPSGEAAGFSIFEQGAKGMGFAGAFTAQASDASAIFHNPAGIAFLEGTQIYAGGIIVHPSSDFVGADPFPGSSVPEEGNAGIIVPPSAYLTKSIGGRVAVGIGVFVPFGLKTSWENEETYSGRFLSQEADLRGVAINPTVAARLSDRFSVGAGVDIRLSSVKLRRRVPAVNPFTLRVIDAAQVVLESDMATSVGFNGGALLKATDKLSFGASYRHKVETDYEGQANFTLLPTGNPQLDGAIAALLPGGDTPVTTRIEFPSVATFGVAVTQGSLTIAGDAVWFQWSTFDRLPLTFTERPQLSSVIEEEYENSWQYRIGIEKKLSTTVAVRGGYFYDESPAPTESVSPLLPDAARHGFCAGTSLRVGAVNVDVGSWYLRFKERSTEGLHRERYNGTYKSSAITFGLSLGYAF